MSEVLQLLESKLIPWAIDCAPQRLFVARETMSSTEMPPGATLSSRKPQGQRVIVKNQRNHDGERLFIAQWPDDNLQEVITPRMSCVVSGEADYLLGEYSLRCGAGTLILIPSRALHQRHGPFLAGERLQNGHCSMFHIYAYSHGLLVWSSHCRNARHTAEPAEKYLLPNMAAVQIFNLIFKEAIAGEENFAIACNGLLSAFFTLVAREIKAGRYTHPGPEIRREAPVVATTDFAGQLHEIIAANFNRPLNIEEAAAQMFLSSTQFCYRVRAETGETFGELRTRYRIERACELLRETDWTATAIAHQIGLKSSSHFYLLFRRRMGISAIDYRREKTVKSHAS